MSTGSWARTSVAPSLAVGGGRMSRPPRAVALSRMIRAIALPRSPSLPMASTASQGSVPNAPPTALTPARTMIRASGLSSTSCAGQPAQEQLDGEAAALLVGRVAGALVGAVAPQLPLGHLLPGGRVLQGRRDGPAGSGTTEAAGA